MTRVNRAGFARQPSLWARIFFLAQPFAYESTRYTVSEAAERVHELDRIELPNPRKQNITAAITPSVLGHDYYTFLVIYRQWVTYQNGNGGWQETAEVSGRISFDQYSGATLIEGTHRVTQTITLWLGLIFLCFSLPVSTIVARGALQYDLNLGFFFLMGVVVTGVAVVYLGRATYLTIRDRQELVTRFTSNIDIDHMTDLRHQHRQMIFDQNAETTYLVDLETNTPVEKRKPKRRH